MLTFYDERVKHGSDLQIGESGPEVEMWQSVIGTSITGNWSEKDEQEYQRYSERSVWAILKKSCDFPKFWEVV